MDREQGRAGEIEARLARLERRLARLEMAVRPPEGAPSEEAAEAADQPSAPPMRAAALPPTPGVPPQPTEAVPPPPVQPPVRSIEPTPAPSTRQAPPPPIQPIQPTQPARSRPAPPPPPGAVPASPASVPASPARPVPPAATPPRIPSEQAPVDNRWWSAADRAAATPTAAPSGPAMSLHDLEERFAGRALAWVGGIALVGAAIFFLSLAFSRGWITPPMRVVIGLVAGVALLGGGAALLARRNPLVGNVLAGVGLGIISVALYAATRLYGLVAPELGLAAALASACAAAAIAVRYDARSVAAYGLIAALLAPPIVGAQPTVLTLLFVAVTLVGTTAIALFRSWRWLPQLAFVLAAPQVADWIGRDPDLTQALVALAGFWLVNVVAAGGEEVRIRRDDLRPSSATLVLANAAFLLWGLLTVLDGPAEGSRGLAVAAASAAHLATGAWFLRRQGAEHLFGNLLAGTGVALLTIAAFIQLGAPAVPVAWAAEAAALAWLAARRLHRWSALGAVVLGGLAITHLVLVEYPAWDAGIPSSLTFDPPLLHPEAATLGALLVALLVAGAVVPARWVRSAIAGVGVLLVAYAALFEASGTLLAAVLVATGLAGLAIDRGLARLPSSAAVEAALPRIGTTWLASLAALVPGTSAIALLFATELPASALGTVAPSPFLNPAFASLAVVVAGLAAAGAMVPDRALRSILGGLGVLLLTWGLAFQVEGAILVGSLAALLPAACLLDRWLARLAGTGRPAHLDWSPFLGRAATVAGAVAWIAGALYAGTTLLMVSAWGDITPPSLPFSDERALAAALMAGAAVLAMPILEHADARRVALIAAIAVGAWVTPFEVFADGVVVLWVVLAAIAVMVASRDARGALAYAIVAQLLWAGALIVAIGIVARPDRLTVADPALVRIDPLLAAWPLAMGALIAGLWAAPRHALFASFRRPLGAGAAVIALYAVSVGVVDLFQRQAGGGMAVEELGKQAQVALSVCWTAIGAGALAIGFARGRSGLRQAGLGLLGLATAKVFLIDLAFMDVAYRALVLAGLGLLLLASAWIVTRFRGPRAAPPAPMEADALEP